MIHKNTTDVAIIGAGPVGIFMIFQCGMLGLRCHVIDALPAIGGQCTALYPEKPIYDIPAYPRITGGELIARLEQQAHPFSPSFHLGQKVISCEAQDTKNPSSTRFTLTTSAGITLDAGAVVIAGGAGIFGPNRPPLSNLEAFEGTSVHYMVPNKDMFAGKNLVIAGGGDSAVDWALALAPIAQSLTLVHRRDRFRALPESVRQLHELADAGTLSLAIPRQLKSLGGNPDTGQLTEVTLAPIGDGEDQTLATDHLLAFYGLAADIGPMAEWGLQWGQNADKHRLPVTPSSCETSRSGIYAIGDMALYEGKLKLILQGFSEASMAAHHLFKRLRPDDVLDLAHSTDKGISPL